jgi:sulfite exporter TauE/SafE
MRALLLTAFVVGLAGGVHCVAMCGGLVAALNARSNSPGSGLRRQLAYSVGRIAGYAVAGAVVGAAGSLALLLRSVLPAQLVLLVAANGLVILLGLSLAGARTPLPAIERAGLALWRSLPRRPGILRPARTGWGAAGIGLAWGFLPCGLVYSVLATALVSGGALRGAAVMAAFGAGTLPNLLAVGLAADRIHRVLGNPLARATAGVAIALLGAVGLARVPLISEHLRQGLHLHH